MILLGLLGFTNVSHVVPLNDKILHFVCMFVATAVFYFVRAAHKLLQVTALMPLEIDS